MSSEFVAVVLFVMIGGLTLARYIAEETRKKGWQNVAVRLGLQYRNDRIAGILDGTPVSVWQEQRGITNTGVICFRCALSGEDPVYGLLFESEGLSKVVGAQDIQLDLPGVDNKLMVRATSPAEVREWAKKPEVTQALTELVHVRSLSMLQVDRNAVYFEVLHGHDFLWRPTVDDLKELEACVRQMASISRLLSGGPAKPPRSSGSKPIEISEEQPAS